MVDLKVKDKDGNEVETLPVRDDLFGKYVSRKLLHNAVLMYEANKRQGTASTKIRSEVAGSGIKPWRQKGTGRARVGTIRSPIWRSGGVVFGPRPRDYSYSLPKKALRKALAGALLSKIRDSQLHIINTLEFEQPGTKQMAQVLANLGIEGSVCVVLGPSAKNVHLSARNIPAVEVRRASDLNAHDVLLVKSVLFTREAFSICCERVGRGVEGGAEQ